MWRLKAGVAIILGVALCVSVAAQGGASQGRKAAGAKAGPGKAIVALTPEQQYALEVLDQLLSSSKEFEDDRLRIKTQAQIADILWPYDEGRARGVFREAFEAIASAKLESSKGGGIPSLSFGPASPLIQLQSEVLNLVARRDPDLAEDLIGTLKGAPGGGDAPPAAAGAERGPGAGLYLETAVSIADTNPQRAVRLAEAGLADGIDVSVLRVLYALRRTSPAQADLLYRSVLAAARRDTGHTSVNFNVLASYALPEFSGSGSPAPYTGEEGRPDNPLITELLNFAFGTYMALAFPPPTAPGGAESRAPAAPSPIDYATGQRLLPYFARYLPDKAVQFRSALETIAVRLKGDSLMEAVQKLTRTGSADELENQAASVKDPFQRDLLYLRAAMSASGGGDFERALAITEKVSAEDFRGALDSVVRFQAATASLGKGEVDSSLRYAGGVSDMRHRAFLLAKIARSLLDQKNAPRASEVLADAEKTIGRAREGSQKAQALLVIAEVKVRLDPTQGFESMEETVKAFNSADSAAVDKPAAAPGVGSMMTAMLAGMLKLEAPDFAPSFLMLARTDFNRAVQLARKLERKDRAVLAQVAACRGILVKQTERKS